MKTFLSLHEAYLLQCSSFEFKYQNVLLQYYCPR
jgi:hypothetical protein